MENGVKLGFWALGLPNWNNRELARRAAEFGYDGVDLRCTRPGRGGRPSGSGNVCIGTSRDEVDAIRAAFEAWHVEVASLLCYLPDDLVAEPGSRWDLERLEDDIVDHARLAGCLGTRRIRLGTGTPGRLGDWDSHLERLWHVTGAALDRVPGIEVVFENHVPVPAEILLETAEGIGDPRIGVEFSPDHCVVMHEDPVDLVDRYAPWVRQVCLADRKLVLADLAVFDGRYYRVAYEVCEIGMGLVPTGAIVDTLLSSRFDGYISLKWEKTGKSNPDLPDGHVVLAQFVPLMTGFLSR